ncbi:MAG: hypothetical protein OXS29_00630 [bacterium]|nr:hypothetical protein [bacterium]MDE0290245.1 hypothetical protein [bacterium]MDE0438757.1 hypothetical protein [bacterium]
MGTRFAVVGDIHGRFGELAGVLDRRVTDRGRTRGSGLVIV